MRNYDLDTLTALLLDPCLTTEEAQREAAAASPWRPSARLGSAENRTRTVAAGLVPEYARLMTADGPQPGGGDDEAGAIRGAGPPAGGLGAGG